MNQKTIKVELIEINKDTDVLRFNFENKYLDVNLNSSMCQNELKTVFIQLLNVLIGEEKIVLDFNYSKDYKRQMYIEVCQEYIKDLNRELLSSKRKLKTEFNEKQFDIY